MNNSQVNQTHHNQTALITEHHQQQVTQSFNAVIKKLNRIADDIKSERLTAVIEDDENKVQMLGNAVMDIKKFMQDINELSTRWQQGIFNTQTQPKTINTVHHNSCISAHIVLSKNFPITTYNLKSIIPPTLNR